MAKMVGTPERITQMAKDLFREERSLKRLDGWFLIKESYMNHEPEYADMRPMERAANLLYRALEELPLSISENAVFARHAARRFRAFLCADQPQLQGGVLRRLLRPHRRVRGH